jgi:alpha-L-rhamnosidase
MIVKEWEDWCAQWIWPPAEQVPAAKEQRHELVYFRKVFDVPEQGVYRLNLAITADSRYKLFINGQRLWAGPCKGHAHVQYYEELCLDEHIRPGVNVLAAAVVHYAGTAPFEMGEDGPISIWRSQQGGLLLEAEITDEDGQVVELLHSGTSWKCLRHQGYRLQPFPIMRWMGGLEQVMGDAALQDWTQSEYDDSAWTIAEIVLPVRDEYGQLTPWQLEQRPIPLLYEKEKSFQKVVRTSMGEDDGMPAGYRLGLAPLSSACSVSLIEGIIVQAGGQIWLELDAGELTTGYLQLELQGGAGSQISLLYAECYEEDTGDDEIRRKGVRNHSRDRVLRGGYDTFYPAGYGTAAQREIYEPFWFRTFRYVRLEVLAGAEPLTIGGLSYRETGYPLHLEGSFHCSDERYNRLWELSVRTLQRCMHETYEDTPYYEQLQYTMDTRLMMKFTYLLSGDDRLARRAMDDYRASQLPDGMLQSRYPSVLPQVIPSFSLYWIGMIHDHYQYFGDIDLVRRYLPAMLSVLDWFGQRLTPQGLVKRTPRQYWHYFDWVEEWKLGAPACTENSPATLLSLMYAAALGTAAELFAVSGWTQIEEEMLERKAAVNGAVRSHCRSENGLLFRDSPEAGEESQLSQHTQIWAILAGTVDEAEASELLEAVLKDRSLARLSLPMSYYLFRALERSGQYERSFILWDRWIKQLELGLTTLPEIDSSGTRSDCHAWSALPLSEFTRGILGVKSGREGITVEPHCGPLRYASGAVMTGAGLVSVSWKLHSDQERNTLWLKTTWVPGMTITLILPNGEVHLDDSGDFEVTIAIEGMG